MSPNAPATIFVPREDVERGVPRGGDLLKKGTEQVVRSIRGTTEQAEPENVEQQSTVAGIQPGARQAVPQYNPPTRQHPYDNWQQPYQANSQTVKNRVAIIETDVRNLGRALNDRLRQSGVVRIFDSGEVESIAPSQRLTDEADRTTFAIRLQADYGINEVIYLSAPEGLEAGKEITAEIYDGLAGGLMQKFIEVVPSASQTTSPSDGNSVILPQSFTDKISAYLALLPWYGRIIAVQGNRAYVAAGKEAGLRVGQTLRIFKNGRFMRGLGFAPGDLIGTMMVQGYVGPNGSFCVIKDGGGVESNDLVSNE